MIAEKSMEIHKPRQTPNTASKAKTRNSTRKRVKQVYLQDKCDGAWQEFLRDQTESPKEASAKWGASWDKQACRKDKRKITEGAKPERNDRSGEPD